MTFRECLGLDGSDVGPVLGKLLVVLIACSACGDDLPSPTLVDDLRVLAVKADPPEVMVDRVDGVATETGPVSFQALVVDPRGPAMIYEWRFCPVESNETCGDFDQRRAAASPEFRPVLDTARAQKLPGQSQAIASRSARGVEPFTVQLPSSLFHYHLVSSGLGLGNGSWVSAVLEVASGSERLQVQKRVVLGARDLSQWNPELQSFGWQVCRPGGPVAGCVPLLPRTANRNPVITGVEIARSDRPDAPFAPLATDPQSVLTLGPGEVVRLRPVLGPGAEERFQIVESTLHQSDLVVVERKEEVVISWFSTAGKFGAPRTTPQLTKTLDNTFTAPAAAPEAGRLSVFVVARDQRGGVDWTTVEVEVVRP